ncbi:MAG: hypothetical protein D6785_03810 [Planctomycetota bacterium]|nr:MAG: hypothetical protein D6785_03810 [Planctomycetota bacterium]
MENENRRFLHFAPFGRCGRNDIRGSHSERSEGSSRNLKDFYLKNFYNKELFLNPITENIKEKSHKGLFLLLNEYGII